MGIQSTRYITRKQAEEKWVDMKLGELRDAFALAAQTMPDGQIEDEIEEYFDNYMIVDEGDERLL